MTTPGVTVAVCARAHAPAVDRCVDALRQAGARPLVYRAPPGRGLADARNAALDAARGHQILALVEDDVIVADGWLAALERAWSEAGEDCACIGGPITASFASPRPTWLTDAFLGVLGTGQGGSTFKGGNVSFRVEALLGVCGFWPAAGRPELRDWYSEEHHAQHQLTAAGWSSREAPAAAATRLIDPRAIRRPALLTLRARYGARSALIGERRDRATAARVATVSAAGAAAALVRCDEPTAMDRAGRAVENVGGLVPGPLARRDLQAYTDQTPFLHAVPRWPRRTRIASLRRTRPLVLLYHRVDDAPGADVDPETFAAQVELLTRRRTPATVDAIATGDVPPDAVAVTFDDGYAETLRNAQPILAAAKVPATVYVATARTADQRPFWWNELEDLLRLRPGAPLRLTVDGETRAWRDGSTALRHLLVWLQPKLPEIIEAAIEDLRAWAGTSAVPPAAPLRPLTVAELRAAASPLLSFGAHTRTHPNLRFLSADRLRSELVESRGELEHWLGGAPPAGLAYPFGIPGADLDGATRRAAETAGYAYAVVNQPGTIDARSDRYALPRLIPPPGSGRAFASVL